MNAFIGQEVLIKIEGYNSGTLGNNLFIDNINIQGLPIQGLPTASFNSSAPSICAGQTVAFSDQSASDITSLNWSFPGGTPSSSNQANPTVTYPNAGSYSVTLEVTNANGTNSTTNSNYVVVNPLSSEVTAVTECVSYTWNGNTYTNSGTYTFSGINTNGCDSTATLNLTVTPIPSIPIVTISNNNLLSIPSQVDATYQWILCTTGLNLANQTNTSFSPTLNGIYAVEVTNNCGTTTSECVTINNMSLSEISKTISIYPNPTDAEIIISGLSNAEIEFQIHDATGRLIFNGISSNQDNVIDVKDISTGIYYLILNGFSPIKFVKE